MKKKRRTGWPLLRMQILIFRMICQPLWQEVDIHDFRVMKFAHSYKNQIQYCLSTSIFQFKIRESHFLVASAIYAEMIEINLHKFPLQQYQYNLTGG